jgi:hypothetical protein
MTGGNSLKGRCSCPAGKFYSPLSTQIGHICCFSLWTEWWVARAQILDSCISVQKQWYILTRALGSNFIMGESLALLGTESYLSKTMVTRGSLSMTWSFRIIDLLVVIWAKRSDYSCYQGRNMCFRRWYKEWQSTPEKKIGCWVISSGVNFRERNYLTNYLIKLYYLIKGQ